MPRLILASQSPRRLTLLNSINITPDKVISPDIDETERKGELPQKLARRLAVQKNQKVGPDYPEDIILTADTVVSAGRFILPKAETKEDFFLCMERISGRRHKVMTGVAVCDPSGTIRSKVVTSLVKVKKLTIDEINAFYATEEWKGKAGGYALQGYFGQFITMLSGSYSTVIGLPVYETAQMLYHAGLKRSKNESLSNLAA
ncbi:MAG: nucleoside triphosphate pyrophosphatase [Pseudomonadota bacterium]